MHRGRPWKGPRRAMFTRVDPTTAVAVRKAAAREGVTMNDFVERVLRAALDMTSPPARQGQPGGSFDEEAPPTEERR